MPAIAELSSIVLDSADPVALASFYQKVTGWEVTSSDPDYAAVSNGGPITIGFNRVEGYRGPSWPDARKHAHFDLSVPDVEQATKEILELGATRPDFQPGGADWTVLADPEGHLFCLAAS